MRTIQSGLSLESCSNFLISVPCSIRQSDDGPLHLHIGDLGWYSLRGGACKQPRRFGSGAAATVSEQSGCWTVRTFCGCPSPPWI